MRGLALALSWLTVLPVRTGAPDARTAAAALRWAPIVGALVGALTGAVAEGAVAVGVPPLVSGLLAVGAGALATRGMHVDGLADTADGLGCYGPPERALAVMRDGGAGPFAVVTLLVVLGSQAGALATLAGPPGAAAAALSAGPATHAAGMTSVLAGAAAFLDGHAVLAASAPLVAGPMALVTGPMALVAGPAALAGDSATLPPGAATVAAAALAGAAGRAAFAWIARRGVPAARPAGLGATVAGSQRWWVAPAWWLALAAAGFGLAGTRGVVAVALGAVLVVGLSWHTARRLGGMSGDVLGAACELAATVALVVLATA